MFSGVHGESWVIRLSPADREALLAAGGDEFAPMGRVMKEDAICRQVSWRMRARFMDGLRRPSPARDRCPKKGAPETFEQSPAKSGDRCLTKGGALD